jgi:inorganic pyrophosphatase
VGVAKDLQKLPVRSKDGDVHVVVETPRGSAAKLEFDSDMQVFIIGALEVLQSEKGKKRLRNDRLIAVPRDSRLEQADRDARTLPKPVRKEIEKFFVATDELDAKRLKFLGWKGPKVGKRLIDKAAKRFGKSKGKS